jgi:hypothetical protein
MIRDIHWYSWQVVRPRTKSILYSSELWLAIIIGILAGWFGGKWIPTTTTTATVSMAFLTYASIALGFSLAGLTLTLTLPNDGFVELLATTIPKNRKEDSYSGLLFIFSWTAIIHWLLVVVTVVLVLFVKPDQPAFEINRHQIRSGLVAGFSAYCLFQFLLTLFTLAQVGMVYIAHIQGRFKKRVAPPE